MLRSYSKKTGEGGAVGVTQPIPFNLSAGVRKRRHSAGKYYKATFNPLN